jgi:hypothetical protein
MSRPVDGDGSSEARCDIGAFEYQGTESTPSQVYSYSNIDNIFRINESYSNVFEVVLLGEYGGEVPGVPVTFSAPSYGPGGVFSDTGRISITVITDENGFASSGDFTTNEEYGVYRVGGFLSMIKDSIHYQVRNVKAKLSTYDMDHRNDDYLPGEFLCNERSLPCTNGHDLDADHAHQYALDVYEFYYQQHQRDSINNQGMEIISSVHYAFAYNNAFWNGAQVIYGDDDNFARIDDIVAHEITHGVTEHTSNLFSYYQSGAINESFSDLWAEAFDQTNGSGLDDPVYLWQIGEELSSGAVRSMNDPTLSNSPDKISSPFYHLGDLEDLTTIPYDNGGVHTNSGVNNKAVYLMVNGDTFNGYNINGIGWEKVLAIYYEVQTSLLTSGSDYRDLYFALQQACANQIGGAVGISPADCEEVEQALLAVEMNLEPVTDFHPEAGVCPGDTFPSVIFSDNFESGFDNWTGNTEWAVQLQWSKCGWRWSALCSVFESNQPT